MTDKDPISEFDLHAYLDGELTPERRRAVEAYLAGHPEAAERLAEWAAQGEAIRAAHDPVLSEPLPQDLVAAARRRRRPAPWIAAAAALVATFASGYLAGVAFNQGSGETLALAGLQAHQLYIPEKVHPVEVAASDRSHLESWLSKRVGLAVAAPDLAASGLTLLGGRVAPVDGRAGALFMYENTVGERFTLLVAKAPGQDRALAYHEAGAFGAYDWADAGYGFVLAGPHDEARLESLQKSVEANWL